MCVAVPKLKVPKKKTKVSRGVIPKNIKLTDSILNLSNASAIVAGFMKKDPELIGNSIKDVIVEPARQHMIPGFSKVKQNALKAGALGVTISGAGPSVIAFSKNSHNLKKICLQCQEDLHQVKQNVKQLSANLVKVLQIKEKSMANIMKKAVVVFSGGIDSVCAVSFLKSKYELYGITFSYGQKANKEINSAKSFAKKLN